MTGVEEAIAVGFVLSPAGQAVVTGIGFTLLGLIAIVTGRELAEKVNTANLNAQQTFSPAKPGAVSVCPITGHVVYSKADENNKEDDGGVFGPGTLTEDEVKELQEIADKHNTPIDVIGSRAAGKGRNIGKPNAPAGKGEGTRSDIDVRIDGQADIDSSGGLSADVSNASGGAGSVASSAGNIIPSQRPVIQFRPGAKPVYLK